MGEIEEFEASTDQRRHVIDFLWAYTARQSVSSEAREKLDELPGPTISRTFAQMRELIQRSRSLGDLRAIPVQVLTWENPAQTLTALFGYTMVCYYPHLLACIPLFVLLTAVFIPNYARKYPSSPEYIPYPRQPSEFDDKASHQLLPQQHETAERDIVAAVREGQLSIEKLCAVFDKFDAFNQGPGNFVVPANSCALFLIIFIALLNTAYVTSFVNLTYLFVGVGWSVVLLSNPTIKAKLDAIEAPPIKLTLIPTLVALLSSGFEFNDPPITRQVEIFELQKEGLTPRMWDTVLFTPVTYSANSPYRLSQQYPPGAQSLNEIACPHGWEFRDNSFWAEDPDGSSWVNERGLLGFTTEGPWAYDFDKQYRRRRLLKTCYYAPEVE